MATNKSFMAQELPEEEMRMLYRLLGKSPPKKQAPQPRFRLNFGFRKNPVEDDNY